MERLKASLEQLDETISGLEEKVGIDATRRVESQKKITEILKQGKAREAAIMGTAQKVALRLDQTIEHVEKILERQDS